MQNGRKSSGEHLSVVGEGVAAIPGGMRPEPPEGMGERRAQVWRDYVGSMPAGWFGRETWPLLRLLCTHTVFADNLAEEMAELGPAQHAARKRIFNMLERETKTVMSLCWQLRLTPKSRTEVHRKDEAAAGLFRRPWEEPPEEKEPKEQEEA